MSARDYSHGWRAGAFYLVCAVLFVKALWFSHGVEQLILVGFCFTAFGIASLMGRRHARAVQILRDAEAQRFFARVLNSARSSAAMPDFFLYLRPFETTNRIRFASDDRHFGPSVFAQAMDLEVALSRAVAPAPMLGLGEPGEHVGVGRVLSSEAEWQEAVQVLAREARAILLLPSSREGTRWEIELVRNRPELLRKSIFIMLAKGPGIVAIRYNVTKEWEQAREYLRGARIYLPPYHWKGLLFTLNDRGEVAESLVEWDLANPLKMGTAIKKLVPTI